MKMKTYEKVLRNKDQSNYEKYGHSLIVGRGIKKIERGEKEELKFERNA